jgi:hypothetical protein
MSIRVFVCLALTAACSAFAGEVEFKPELEPGMVRQLNATQAHLQAMQPKEERRKPAAAAMARLVGKMLSKHVKGLDLDLSNDAAPTAPGLQEQPGALRLNRRAEICYENYRLAIKRGGMVMRYEMDF